MTDNLATTVSRSVARMAAATAEAIFYLRNGDEARALAVLREFDTVLIAEGDPLPDDELLELARFMDDRRAVPMGAPPHLQILD